MTSKTVPETFSESSPLLIHSEMSGVKSPEHHQKTYNVLKGPILIYSLLTVGYVASMPGKWIWFSWHPLAMAVSFVLLASNAILIKRIGGYNNTKLHGYLMGAAVVAALFGWYAIYVNKEMSKKQHLTTLHAQLGLVAILGYIGLGLFGSVALDPEWGMFKTNQTFRALHKFAGRLMTALAWIVCVMGESVFF